MSPSVTHKITSFCGQQSFKFVALHIYLLFQRTDTKVTIPLLICKENDDFFDVSMSKSENKVLLLYYFKIQFAVFLLYIRSDFVGEFESLVGQP